MKKELISKNKKQSIYRLHSYEDAKKHFPNAHFSSSKRTWRLFLDIEALSQKLLEDFTKHLLLFNNDGDEYYIVVNIGDQVDETNIQDRKLLKDATKLMKDYSVSQSFIEFIKSNKEIKESERITHIKKFVPEIYLDYVIENNLNVETWDWLPRNLIKKQLLSDIKYFSYLLKKDKENKKKQSSAFIVNYILSGNLTKKTISFLKELFEDKSIESMFQETIDAILLGENYTVSVSLTKSILKNIYLIEKENIVSFNSFNGDFIYTLQNNFKEEHLEYLDILIDKKVKYIVNPDDRVNYCSDKSTRDYFFDEERFKYLISHSEDFDSIIESWRPSLSEYLFSYCFISDKNKFIYNKAFQDKPFDVKNLGELLKNPLHSQFVFFEDFIKETKSDRNRNTRFSEVIAQTDLNLILEACPNDEFFKNEIIKHYTRPISIWNGENFDELDYCERINEVIKIDKENIHFINLTYLFEDKYEHLNDIYDFDYNSIPVQQYFNVLYSKYEKAENMFKTGELSKIKRLAETKRFIENYDREKWENKNLIEIFDPIVNFDTNFDINELKSLFSNYDVEGIETYCKNNRERIKNTFKRNPDDPFIKMIKTINSTLLY